MTCSFTPITLDATSEYLHYWEQTPQRSIDYTLSNLWGWARYYGLQWAFSPSLCWIRQEKPTPVFWAPIGDWEKADWDKELPWQSGTQIIRVPEQLAHIWEKHFSGRITREEDRGHWEYLYAQKDLAELPGNRFHKKKNHVNAFLKTYGTPDYRPFDGDCLEDVLMLQDEWCQWHECAESNSLQAENEAINRVLAHWTHLPSLTGSALYAENRIVAFSVGEMLDAQNLGVHYEKGRNSIRGVYQTINMLFAAQAGKDCLWINRAQDLNEEGLRQAKMTYLPVDFLKKYIVTFL